MKPEETWKRLWTKLTVLSLCTVRTLPSFPLSTAGWNGQALEKGPLVREWKTGGSALGEETNLCHANCSSDGYSVARLEAGRKRVVSS